LLSKNQFTILYALLTSDSTLTQRELSDKTNYSLGKVNSLVSELLKTGFISKELKVTEAGIEALAPYKVDNAIIMAAGMSSRFAPLSYEKPKALLKVKGEILIERQIKQLQEAGIKDITIVLGYLKESLFYLEEKFGVKIVVNEDYYKYNNTSTLLRVLDKLQNTYVCSSDNYFSENVFEKYVYDSFYSAVYAKGKTDEYCAKADHNGLIKKVTLGGSNSWCMLGHVYWSKDFSDKFKSILLKEYDNPITRNQLWEELYIRHIKELPIYLRKYDESVIKEFDSLDELRSFDSEYVTNVDSFIFKNIKSVLNCRDIEICDINPIKSGLTNVSFYFSVNNKKYVYRHPGTGTDLYINRKSEAASMKAAKELGIDDSYIFIHPTEGWKISYYIRDARTMDYENDSDVTQSLDLIRKLHNGGIQTDYDFDIWGAIEKFEKSLTEKGRHDFEDMTRLHDEIFKIKKYVTSDNYPKTLSHGDCYDPNFLIDKNGKMFLIDWEYSGMADPAADLGTYLACSKYNLEKSEALIAQYLEKTPSENEMAHYLGYAAVLSYYWFIWAIYQDSVGKEVGEYLYLWYKATKTYAEKALFLYSK